MATAQQIKALIKSHFEDGNERFISLALQLAAHEARQGHSQIAEDIKLLIDKSKGTGTRKTFKALSPELSDLVLEVKPQSRLNELIVREDLQLRIQRILKEFHKKQTLIKFGLENRRKILLSGPPGTGKTMTASVIAHELEKPLYIILMDKMVTKFMGETSAKLRQIFDLIRERPGVYLFDEFDAIGSERNKENDVGEMRRVLNSFLQFIEYDKSESLIVAATNSRASLDYALFRRFDDVLTYSLPNKKETALLVQNKLAGFYPDFDIKSILNSTSNLSHAEITQACIDSIKHIIINNQNVITLEIFKQMISDRVSAYKE
ncbi:ATP-binding protein [Salegentibacter sp. BDJ18]|uniref:AAA family ATPase n=1 Tax=Salegentibacter sp. BDJ18 TaxID=2816376 RepID=UPI001AAE6323|nr:ATP-binding protein [Salegentibacter sp. BDJ18]MBO2544072.1 ATP-binding protein [Salegentibacter sp. BDJ18]